MERRVSVRTQLSLLEGVRGSRASEQVAIFMSGAPEEENGVLQEARGPSLSQAFLPGPRVWSAYLFFLPPSPHPLRSPPSPPPSSLLFLLSIQGLICARQALYL